MKKIISYILFILIPGIFLSVALFYVDAAAGKNEVGIQVMKKATVGKFLAAGNGMTLYSYARDENNLSRCSEGCAVNWPPFYADTPTVGEDLQSGDFTTILREDGRKQTTYKGRPLYHFKNDAYPGDTFGKGIGEVWLLVTP